jgi:hypothetical protein
MKTEGISSLHEYQSARKEYLVNKASIVESLNPQNSEEKKEANALAREALSQKLQSLIQFRSEFQGDLGISIYHTTDKNAWDGQLATGNSIFLVPDKHNKKGRGVYFLETDSFKFYKNRRHTKDSEKSIKPITFVLNAADIAGGGKFRKYDYNKQGKGRHSNNGLVKITITKIDELPERLMVHGSAERLEATKENLELMQKAGKT